MPSLVVVVIAIVLAISSVLVALIALSRRQYDSAAPVDSGPSDERPPGSGGLPSPTELAPVLAACLDETTRVRARNSREEAAVAAVRDALHLAVDAAFALEINEILDGIEGIEVLNDVRQVGTAGTAINHLVAAPAGVVIVESLVRTAKLTVDGEVIQLGRDRETKRELRVDEIMRKRSAIADLVEPVPVHAVMVFQDALTLPAEIREGMVQVKGVRLMTPLSLTAFLVESGEFEEVALVAAVLRDRFRPALSAPGPDRSAARPVPAPGPPPIPPTSTVKRASTSSPVSTSDEPRKSEGVLSESISGGVNRSGVEAMPVNASRFPPGVDRPTAATIGTSAHRAQSEFSLACRA